MPTPKAKPITDWREALAFLLMHSIEFTNLKEDGRFEGFRGLKNLIGRELDEQFQKRPMQYDRGGEPQYSREVLIQAAQAVQEVYSDEYNCYG